MCNLFVAGRGQWAEVEVAKRADGGVEIAAGEEAGVDLDRDVAVVVDRVDGGGDSDGEGSRVGLVIFGELKE